MRCQSSPLIFLALYLITSNSRALVEGVTYQQISFYSEYNQQGTRNPWDDNILQTPSPIVQNSKSFCIDQGLWKATLQSSPTNTTELYGGTLGSAVCINRDENNALPFVSLKYVGARDLETSSLTLFSKGKYQGVEDFLEESTPSKNYSSPFNVHSYFITGKDNWAVYNDTEGGSVTCLRTVVSGDGSYGARGTAYVDPPLKVGAVRRGCGDEVTTTRRPGDSGGQSLVFNCYIMLLAVGMSLWGNYKHALFHG